MLYVAIPDREFYDENTEEFFTIKAQNLQLEHSLVSLSKWESIWKKPFLDKRTEKSDEETIDYIRCMTINQNVSPDIYYNLPGKIYEQIRDYINAPMSATWISRDGTSRKNNGEIVTAEVIYYWMIALNVPMECQKWHINKLITLIEVCNIKNQKPKKMSRKAQTEERQTINAKRRAELNSKG